MKFILGTKQQMIQFFTAEGLAHAATVVQAGPIVVTQVKTKDTDGYSAVQVGFGTQKEQRINKPQRGHMADRGLFRTLREFRITEEALSEYTLGESASVDIFTEGEIIDVSGISKGKGFQGGVKRHGFAGGRRSHGQKHSEREGGSIGATGPARVFKGTRMPGRMGSDRITVKNLEILALDPENNQMIIKGAIPGRPGTLLEIVARTK